jgi:3-oxoacyl-[acyl-carrier protein] reductase
MILAGKTAIITGCLRGIGRAALDVFVKNGATVFACCEKETEEFNDHINRILQHHGKKADHQQIIPLYFDLSDEAAIKESVRVIQKTKKTIDVLVNIAGVTNDALFHMLTMEQLNKTFTINFFAPVLLTQYVTRLMLKNNNGGGSIIFVSSISALDGSAGQMAYASSKAALIGATLTLSREFGPKNIRVNAIAPGVIDTMMTKHLPSEVFQRQMNRSSFKRVGLPEEVANVILYLASDVSSYITGQVIRIDGGIG